MRRHTHTCATFPNWHIHIHMHMHTHRSTCTCTRTCTQARAQAHAQINTNAYAHMRTYTCTNIYMCTQRAYRVINIDHALVHRNHTTNLILIGAVIEHHSTGPEFSDALQHRVTKALQPLCVFSVLPMTFDCACNVPADVLFEGTGGCKLWASLFALKRNEIFLSEK